MTLMCTFCSEDSLCCPTLKGVEQDVPDSSEDSSSVIVLVIRRCGGSAMIPIGCDESPDKTLLSSIKAVPRMVGSGVEVEFPIVLLERLIDTK
mmetsp:Transcript_32238/g.48082  ORF Transcript_32238/g.48082 Transcript_32238/m.48082 type:complete len:93 (+) Transcript_32238:3651-3929(+)